MNKLDFEMLVSVSMDSKRMFGYRDEITASSSANMMTVFLVILLLMFSLMSLLKHSQTVFPLA